MRQDSDSSKPHHDIIQGEGTNQGLPDQNPGQLISGNVGTQRNHWRVNSIARGPLERLPSPLILAQVLSQEFPIFEHFPENFASGSLCLVWQGGPMITSSADKLRGLIARFVDYSNLQCSFHTHQKMDDYSFLSSRLLQSRIIREWQLLSEPSTQVRLYLPPATASFIYMQILSSGTHSEPTLTGSLWI